MAVETIRSTQLRLVFYDGVNPETGDPMYARKNFNNIKPEATATALNAVAKAFSSLQSLELYEVHRQDLSAITE